MDNTFDGTIRSEGAPQVMAKRSIEFATKLRYLRQTAGMSQSELAEAVRRNRSWISKVETGRGSVSATFARRCDDVLRAGGALIALVPNASGPVRKGRMPDLVGLPPATQRFVGRVRELDEFHRFISDERGVNVCFLSGMAGVGKTAIALSGAWDAVPHFPDGLLFIDFGGHTPGAARLTVHEAFASLLGLLKVPNEDIPADTVRRANLYQSQLRGKRVLLVFDNVRGSDQVKPLLPAEPKCKVVVTSRERLNGLDEAMRILVNVLPAAEASQLFLSSAGEQAEGAEAETIAQILEFCGHLGPELGR